MEADPTASTQIRTNQNPDAV
jgi:hypothetical protein